jgi:hypothetical protein
VGDPGLETILNSTIPESSAAIFGRSADLRSARELPSKRRMREGFLILNRQRQNPTAFAPAAQPRPATPWRTLPSVPERLQFRAMAIAKWVLQVRAPPTRTTLR